MSGDPGVRRHLPQNSQMQTFSFTPANFAPRENQKNYVFVDEHNRHKRLKVMRACEGCRRRKIKCDAATTNTWPCSACIRLKLHCVPPSVQYDAGNGIGFEPERGEYESGSGDDEYQNQISIQQHLGDPPKSFPQIYPPQIPYADGISMYHSISHAPPLPPDQHTIQFSNMHGPAGALEEHYPSQSIYPVASILQQPPSQSPDLYHQEQYSQQDLVDILGDLKVDVAGSAPYLSSKKKHNFVEEPAFEDADVYKDALPSITSGPDLKIRIPPELMPDEETALHYFDLYFSNVHPYVPVLNKTLFYQQWHSNRESISPLILEAIFAIAGKLADEPSQGQQWLALAGKHADSFMDVPRLSTLQAMLIVLKARESAPKRGYYYRSWMTIVQCVAMAKDLGLDEHLGEHKAGRPCGSSPTDCIMKTRIWQTIFICELIIGSPQGRTDLAVDPMTVDFNVPRPIPGEESEFHVTRNFTYLLRIVRNVRNMNGIYARLKSKKEWGIEPEFVQLNPTFEAWLNDLPSDLQISFPTHDSPPWLPSHFVGNMHSYYYLSIILLHRPQLTFREPSGVDGEWKQHMMICYSSAKLLCRLQEALLELFGLPGLLCMQRGINFTIYCVLSCTVLHLVALTSPDPDLNSDARDYFTRHMRILEKCSSSWPMPEMQQQIDALREAFSADIRKPFVLKPTFPYGSPSVLTQPSPPRTLQYRQHPQLSRPSSMEQQSLEQHHAQQPQAVYTSHPITPPISASSTDTNSDSPAVQSLVMMATGQRLPQQDQQQQPISGPVSMVDPSTWNPSRIFDQWNNSFGTPNVVDATAPHLTPLRIPTSSGSQEVTKLQGSPNLTLTCSQATAPEQFSSAPIPSFVSPSMWQESVASVYEGGLKRQWDYDSNTMVSQVMKRNR